MKLLIYLLGIIGSTGSLIYSFDFNSNPNLIFFFCVMIGLVIYLGYTNTKNKRQFIIGGLVIDGILLMLPNTLACFSYLVSTVVHKYNDVCCILLLLCLGIGLEFLISPRLFI